MIRPRAGHAGRTLFLSRKETTMRTSLRTWAFGLAAAAALVAGVAAARAKDEPKKPAPAMEMEAWEKMNAAGPHHKAMERFAGEWDAEVTTMMPDGSELRSKGKQTARMILGGKFLETTFEGSMMGKPYHGRGLMGYDNMKKKYVSTWADSMSTGIMVFVGDAPADGKVFTSTAEQTSPDGKTEMWREVTTVHDDRSYTFDMFVVTPDGKDFKMMSIKYTKAK
jgi:hypothetical protein